MRSIKLSLALVAALTFSVGITGTAFAESFLSSVSKAKLLSTGVQTQIFKTNAGTLECKEAKIEAGETGTAGSEEKVQLAEVHYSQCLFFGFIPTTFTNFDYLYLPNGTVHLDNAVTLIGSGCELNWPAQLVSTVKYVNAGNNIKLEPNISGILYTAKGCPSGNGEAKNGTLTGNSETMIASGKLSFMSLVLWNRTEKYVTNKLVEWTSGSGVCWIAKEENQAAEPVAGKTIPWEKATCP